jgi:hypothetical protein
MIIPELKKLKLQEELVSINRDCGDDDLTGIVEFVTEEVIALRLYTEEGLFDGFTLFEINQISEILWGDREHKAMALLIQKHGEKRRLTVTSETLLEIAIELSSVKNSIYLFHSFNEDNLDLCKIISNDDEWLKLDVFGSIDTLSKSTKLIQSSSVLRITVDSPYQDKIVELHKSGIR